MSTKTSEKTARHGIRTPLLAAALVSLGLLSALPASAAPAARDAWGDRLLVTVSGAGAGGDGTVTLRCHPAGGSHREAGAACARLDEVTRWGRDTFAPVPKDALCTMQYGGPQTARITGRWAGRHVDASYKRTNGCEISRWDALVPVLPSTTRPDATTREGAVNPTGATPRDGASTPAEATTDAPTREKDAPGGESAPVR
ncbi:SSI family serine proteinase inhibitor [Streptomyces sp. NPDC049954]|uniref:SSI family serine proteinase inhibitor n=1 Tax=Streptomyces sp. NPDC049954 TaxID=3155779 RepID=UPI00342E57B7